MANLTSFYIYKVIPSTCPVREPLPERLPVSRGDQDSGFIRLLTARQVPIALKTIFKSEPMVYILRILYKKIMQDILWEPADGAVSEALPEEAFCPVSIRQMSKIRIQGFGFICFRQHASLS